MVTALDYGAVIMNTKTTLETQPLTCLSAPLLDASGSANYIKTKFGVPCASKTLAKLRCTGGGPIFRRFGRLIRYEPHDLDAWAQGRLSQPLRSTSDDCVNPTQK